MEPHKLFETVVVELWAGCCVFHRTDEIDCMFQVFLTKTGIAFVLETRPTIEVKSDGFNLCHAIMFVKLSAN